MYVAGNFWSVLAGFVGILLALVLTVLSIVVIRPPLSRFLEKILGDKEISQLGTTFIVLLLALEGAKAVIGYFTVPELSTMLGGLSNLIDNLTGTVQWAVYMAALLFIGYSVRISRTPPTKVEVENEH